jgi:rod shape-determining protein MreC
VPPFDSPDLTGASARRQTWGALTVVVAALVIGFLPEPAQQTMASAIRGTALKPFLTLQEMLVRSRLRSGDVTRLQARLDSLSLALIERTTIEEENDRLRSLLGLGARLGTAYRAAAVIRPGTPGSESMFMIDLGAADGVEPRAPVLTREGLAGVVREVREHTSVGMDWTNPDFSASAMTADGLTYGFVESHRGEFREGDRLVLSGTPFSTEVASGTLVVTSGLGGVFPRGVPVGRVESLAEAEGGWRKSYWLEPFVDVASVAHALVAVASTDAPQNELSDEPGVPFEVDDMSTRREFLEREAARADSLAELTDEVARLRALVDSLRGISPTGGRNRPPPPDTGGVR